MPGNAGEGSASAMLLIAIAAPLILLIAVFAGAAGGTAGQAAACGTQPAPGTAAAAIPPRYLALYQQAGAQYGIPWTLLAAIGTVESGNGKDDGPSSAGALGPMQFLPSTWAIYGDGGNIDDPAAAIPAAARYLLAAGAPASIPAAVFAYNHSAQYVTLVLHRAAAYADGAQALAAAASPLCAVAAGGTIPAGAVRAAVYEGANAVDRVRAHQALAAALTHAPDRAALQRASATLLPDDEVAGKLEQCAHRQESRGAAISAAATYERAVRLSTAACERVRRLGSSASAAARTGDIVTAARLCTEAVADVTDPTVLAELCWIQYCLAIASERCQRSVPSMVAIAAATPTTPMKLLVLACAALQSHLFGGEPDEMRQAIEAAMLELDLEPSHPLRIQTLCLVNPARYGGQFAPIIAKFAEHASELHALDESGGWGIAVRGGASSTAGIGTAADALHLASESRTLYAAAARLAADIGDLHDLCIGLKNSANRMITAGELDDALATAGQARMSADRGLSLVSAGAAAVQARIFAWRGDRSGVQRCLDDIHDAGACSRADTAALRLWAEGLLALGEGKFGDALELLLGMGVFTQWAMEATGDLVEAAVNLPDGGDRITAHLDAAVAHAAALNSPLLSEVVSRSQGQLAADQLAKPHFERALRETNPSGRHSERARTQLAYGEWLSAHGESERAREQLSAAARTFAAMGAAPWEDRARTGLLATGQVQAKGPDRITRKLSDQEWQVARLVAMGKSNKEIADLLFLSHRTVGAHLYRIFPKLDVRSRTELATRVLADGTEHEMGGGF